MLILGRAEIIRPRLIRDGRSLYVGNFLPDWRTLRRLRFQGCPYTGCEFYTIVYQILPTGQAGDVLAAGEGNAFDCPSRPWCRAVVLVHHVVSDHADGQQSVLDNRCHLEQCQ